MPGTQVQGGGVISAYVLHGRRQLPPALGRTQPAPSSADTRTMNDALADLLWLWSLARRPLPVVLADLESWPVCYRAWVRA